MQEIIRFHLPCDKKYQTMIEEFAVILGKQLRILGESKFTDELKLVMSNVFHDIVKYSNTAAQNEVVRFQFEIGHQFFLISIYDYGPGFKADQFRPPYPKEYIGKSYSLCQTDNKAVVFTVVDPVTISFSLKSKNDASRLKSAEFEGLEERCKNLARITRMMDSISYGYIGQGKYDWKLTKHLV